MSVKNAERVRRAATGSERIHIYSRVQPVPRQWRKFLANDENKESLVAVLFEEWGMSPASLYKRVKVFLAHGQTYHALRSAVDEVDVLPIPSVRCEHEDADARLLKYAHYTADHAATVVIKSLDSDVFIICLGMRKQFPSEQLLHTSTGTNVRTTNLQVVRQQIGDDIAHTSIYLRAINGCDSVGGFYGKRKVKTAKLMSKGETFQQALGEIDMQPALSEGYLENWRSMPVICTVT